VWLYWFNSIIFYFSTSQPYCKKYAIKFCLNKCSDQKIMMKNTTLATNKQLKSYEKKQTKYWFWLAFTKIHKIFMYTVYETKKKCIIVKVGSYTLHLQQPRNSTIIQPSSKRVEHYLLICNLYKICFCNVSHATHYTWTLNFLLYRKMYTIVRRQLLFNQNMHCIEKAVVAFNEKQKPYILSN
jgi:hypothetical protein